MLSIYSKSESRRNFKFAGDTNLDTSKWESKFEVKKSNVKVTENVNVKIVFVLIFVNVDRFTSYRNQNNLPFILHSNSAENRMWSTFVLCSRRKFYWRYSDIFANNVFPIFVQLVLKYLSSLLLQHAMRQPRTGLCFAN